MDKMYNILYNKYIDGLKPNLVLQNPRVYKLGCFVQERMSINLGTKIQDDNIHYVHY
jgi:hypothetical protein